MTGPPRKRNGRVTAAEVVSAVQQASGDDSIPRGFSVYCVKRNGTRYLFQRFDTEQEAATAEAAS